MKFFSYDMLTDQQILFAMKFKNIYFYKFTVFLKSLKILKITIRCEEAFSRLHLWYALGLEQLPKS